jgi:hypothetical protein
MKAHEAEASYEAAPFSKAVNIKNERNEGM